MLDIRTIVMDCADQDAQAAFWSEAAGWTEDPDNPNEPGDPECLLVANGVAVLFVPVPEGKTVKNRVHIDLVPDTTRDETVERVLGLGAAMVADHRREDGTGWCVLADPEGNEFCVERSPAERACR